jgi:hypothetical protein
MVGHACIQSHIARTFASVELEALRDGETISPPSPVVPPEFVTLFFLNLFPIFR